jgi:ATP-dependent Clp protease ATP-binding subunit ClpC
MHERFTDRARKVMALAHGEAAGFDQSDVNTGNLFCALAAEGTGVAAGALKRWENLTNHANLRAIYADIVKRQWIGCRKDVSTGKLLLGMEVKQIIELALKQAQALKHSYVGTEHLLLGLLEYCDDDARAFASQMLARCHLTPALVKSEVLALLGLGAQDPEDEKGEEAAPEAPRAQSCGGPPPRFVRAVADLEMILDLPPELACQQAYLYLENFYGHRCLEKVAAWGVGIAMSKLKQPPKPEARCEAAGKGA